MFDQIVSVLNCGVCGKSNTEEQSAENEEALHKNISGMALRLLNEEEGTSTVLLAMPNRYSECGREKEEKGKEAGH